MRKERGMDYLQIGTESLLNRVIVNKLSKLLEQKAGIKAEIKLNSPLKLVSGETGYTLKIDTDIYVTKEELCRTVLNRFCKGDESR